MFLDEKNAVAIYLFNGEHIASHTVEYSDLSPRLQYCTAVFEISDDQCAFFTVKLFHCGAAHLFSDTDTAGTVAAFCCSANGNGWTFHRRNSETVTAVFVDYFHNERRALYNFDITDK